MLALADELQDTGHPHKDELTELASTAGFDDDPAICMTAGAIFLALLDDSKGKLPKRRD